MHTQCPHCKTDDPGFIDAPDLALSCTCENCGESASLRAWMTQADAARGGLSDNLDPAKREPMPATVEQAHHLWEACYEYAMLWLERGGLEASRNARVIATWARLWQELACDMQDGVVAAPR